MLCALPDTKVAAFSLKVKPVENIHLPLGYRPTLKALMDMHASVCRLSAAVGEAWLYRGQMAKSINTIKALITVRTKVVVPVRVAVIGTALFFRQEAIFVAACD